MSDFEIRNELLDNVVFDSIKDSLSPDFANEDLAKLKINELKQNIDTLLQDLKN